MEQTNEILADLVAALAADDDNAAEAAVISLPAEPATVQALIALAGQGDENARWWAVRGLAHLAGYGESHHAAILPVLLQAVADGDEALRCAAALALGELRSNAGVPALLALLADNSGWVRSAAANALALVGEPAVPALGEALQDPREGVRVRAAFALHRIKSMASARWLFPALSDNNPIVHTYAYETLNELGLLNTVLVM